MIDLNKLQSDWPQRQDSLSDQFSDLLLIANRLGFYDAADAISQWVKNMPEVKYGCHCDLEHGMEPDGCVIDTGEPWNCSFADKAGRKERCQYWMPIKSKNAVMTANIYSSKDI